MYYSKFFRAFWTNKRLRNSNKLNLLFSKTQNWYQIRVPSIDHTDLLVLMQWTASEYHGCKVFPSCFYNSGVSITLAFSHIHCVLDLAPSAILGHCCFRGADFLVDILMMFWMMTRKVFFNLLMQKERYVALWYALGLNFDNCHDSKWHVHFPEWMVSFQTHTECYQIWQVLNDGMSSILDSTTGDLGCCKLTLPPGLAKLTLGFCLDLSSGAF